MGGNKTPEHQSTETSIKSPPPPPPPPPPSSSTNVMQPFNKEESLSTNRLPIRLEEDDNDDGNDNEIGTETLVPIKDGLVDDKDEFHSANTRSFHHSQHLTDEDLKEVIVVADTVGKEDNINTKSNIPPLDKEHSFRPPSKAAVETVKEQLQQQQQQVTSSSTSPNESVAEEQAPSTFIDPTKVSELAHKIYTKGLEESQSQLLDMANNFPHFKESEIVHGAILGKGCFGTVHEIRGFNLHEQPQPQPEQQQQNDDEHQVTPRRRSFDLTRQNVPDEEVPSGDLESRRFMAAHAFRNEGHARYAIKKLSPETIQNPKQLVQGIADLVMEARILSAIEHPNIIKLRALKAGNRFQFDFFLVLDRLYETLDQRIQVWRQQLRQKQQQKHNVKNMFSRLIAFRQRHITKASSYQQRLVQAFHLSAALNYLHRQNLIHRDLKPENIGFDCRGDIKIFDFGMAKEMPFQRGHGGDVVYKFTGMCGSPRYMSPEVAHKRPYNEKCDVYSYAILIYEILSLTSAFSQHHDFDTMFAQVWNPPYNRPNLKKVKSLPEHLYRLIYSAWHYDYRKRPSMQYIADTLKEECLTFPDVTLQSLSHRRRKSKVIYDKEKCVFRVNSMLFD